MRKRPMVVGAGWENSMRRDLGLGTWDLGLVSLVTQRDLD
jgi:hypothetical protein